MTRRVAIGLFVLFFVLSFILSPRIGVSWDEPDNIFAAGQYINFFQHHFDPTILASRDASASVFQNTIFTQEPSLFRYPPVPLYVGALGTSIYQMIHSPILPQQIIIIFHIASGVFWAIFVVALFLLALEMGLSLPFALFTALIGGLHPTIMGYGLSTIKDSAQVALFTLSLLFLVKSTTQKKRKWFIVGSVVWGLGLATKINAVYVPFIWIAWRFLRAVGNHRKRGLQQHLVAIAREIRQSIVLFIGIISVGILIMFVSWPYLWFDPIVRIQAAVEYFMRVGSGYAIYFYGQRYLVGAGTPYPWYPLVHMILGTPIPLLILVGGGIITFLVNIIRRKENNIHPELLLLFWIIAPLVRTLTPTSSFYDGMRHFLEVMPGLFLLMGFGASGLYNVWSKEKYHILMRGVFIGIVVHLVMINTIFFPFSSGYVNALISHPNEDVERDFGGLAVKEGVDLAHTLHKGGLAVYVPIAGHLSWYYLHDGDVYVYQADQSDVVILINKQSHATKSELESTLPPSFKVIGEVKRGNNIFAWVYERR